MLDTLKGALKSKTVWFNAVILGAITEAPRLIEVLPMLKPLLAADQYTTLVGWVTVANVVLRILTTKSLSDK